MTYEQHIEELENATGLSRETIEVAANSMSFALALRNLYVDLGMLSPEAPVDFNVLENLTDALHGELGAASLFLAEDGFKGVPALLRSVEVAMKDPDNVVPVTIKKGFSRLATRIEKAQEVKLNLNIGK